MNPKPDCISLTIDFYKEGENFIAYSPALKISTYAKSFEKAKERFDALTDIFFEELEEKGTTEEVLLECGWRKINHCLQPPVRIAQEEVKIPCPA